MEKRISKDNNYYKSVVGQQILVDLLTIYFTTN